MTPQEYLSLHRPKKRGRFPVSPPEARQIDGITFASRKEAIRYSMLKFKESAGEISELELQPRFDVNLCGVKLLTYTADFKYLYQGKRVIEDVKSSGSSKDAAYRIRKRAAEIAFDIKVTEVY